MLKVRIIDCWRITGGFENIKDIVKGFKKANNSLEELRLIK
ncbi:hypothetical protein OAK82_02310 [Candidatus Thioglobus sp.]|nr:hypothetical protein [Candidatus Thioglobus sp.]